MQLDRYSRLVGWLKVLLPLLALALLSTLFLLSRAIDPESAIPFADKEIQDRLRDQQVTGPVYSGMTAGGDELSFAAAKLTRPEGQTGPNDAEEVEVTLDLVSGSQVRLTSDSGRFDLAANRADLEGNVIIKTSTGYRLLSDAMITSLSMVDVVSPGPVHGDGPLGTLDAGAMHLSTDAAGDAAQLVFTNGVKLVYTPQPNNE